jgi:hypothetical protein
MVVIGIGHVALRGMVLVHVVVLTYIVVVRR